MTIRFNTNHYSLLTAFALSIASALCAHAQTAPPALETGHAALVETHGGLFRVAPAKGPFAYRSDIPLVEQFMKRWDARRRL